MTFFGQTSTQAPQEMHSGEYILSSLTMAFTSRLMGQFFVQSLQSMHFSLSASRWRWGVPETRAAKRPAVMKGARRQP